MHDVVVVGSYIQDLAFRAHTFPAPGETRIGTFKTGAGGKGFNQAVACGRQEVETLYIGTIGDDAFGGEARAFADGERFLTCSFFVDAETPTGAASIVVNQHGQNLITVALGANENLPANFIDSLSDKIAQSKVALCQLESNLEAIAEALRIAHQASSTAILNPAPINEGFSPDILEYVDILTPNETEFLFMLEKLGVNAGDSPYTPENLVRKTKESPEAAHKLCLKIPVSTVIITMGEAGCFVSRKGDRREPFYFVPAKKVETVDSTGAGDAFSGGLAAGLARADAADEGSFKKAVEFANAVAGLSTTKYGTSPSMPYPADVREVFQWQ